MHLQCAVMWHNLYQRWKYKLDKIYLELGDMSEQPTSAAHTVHCSKLPLVLQFPQVKGQHALHIYKKNKKKIMVFILGRKTDSTLLTIFRMLVNV